MSTQYSGQAGCLAIAIMAVGFLLLMVAAGVAFGIGFGWAS